MRMKKEAPLMAKGLTTVYIIPRPRIDDNYLQLKETAVPWYPGYCPGKRPQPSIELNYTLY